MLRTKLWNWQTKHVNLLNRILDVASFTPKMDGEYKLPRGFLSSNDPALCWIVYSDSKGIDKTYYIRCVCGIHKLLDEGRQLHRHLCSGVEWRTELILEDYPARIGKAKI